MPKKLNISDEERKQRAREANRRAYYKRKAAATAKPEELNSPTAKSDAELAALINQKYGYSKIIGQYQYGKKYVIAEQMLTNNRKSQDAQQFRLKTTTYLYFSSLGELKNYAVKNKISLKYN